MAERDVGVGSMAPDFELQGTDDVPFRLSHQLSFGPVMLMFYPNDFGIVCSLQMREFKAMEELKAKVLRPVGISRNSILTHKQWKESMAIPFLLLTDPEGEVCERYAGLQTSGLLKGMPRRSIFIIGRDGVVRYRWVSSAEGVPLPFEEIRSAVAGMEL
ncbi:MAG: redoxin domain-containing protein [Methanomassiliicoccales archaeon]|nr:redoxin domain-containing protein [Methanomassiliicoccales archaeon]